MLSVQSITKDRAAQWNEYVRSARLPVYVLYEWGDVLSAVYDTQMMYFAAVDDQGKICGFCMVYASGGCLYTPYFGFYAPDDEVSAALLKALDIYAVEQNISGILLTSGGSNYFLPQTGNLDAFEKTNLFLPLIYDDEEAAFGAIPKKTRNMVRKAEKEGFSVSIDPEKLEEFHTIYHARMDEKNLNIKPFSFFQALQESFGERLQLFVLTRNSEIQAGMLFLEGAEIVSYLYNASTDEAQRAGGNNLLMWAAMKYYRGLGKAQIELGESTPDGPVYNFKKRLGKDVRIVPMVYARRNYGRSGLLRFLGNKKRGLLQRICPALVKPSPGRLI